MAMKFTGVAVISFLILQLCVAEGNLSSNADIYKIASASFYTGPFIPSGCYGNNSNPFPENQYFAAGGGSQNIWNNGANCGQWFRIKCSGNGCTSSATISVKIVDHCTITCLGLAFDLSDTAFRAIANPAVEVINVQYSGPFNIP